MLISTNGLSIGNTVFKHKQIHKKTWVSPDGKTRNKVDCICISTRWCSLLLDVHAHRGADVGSDHFLVVGKIRLKLKRVQKVRQKRPYAVEKLKNNVTSKSYFEELSKKLEAPQHPSTIEEQWGLFSLLSDEELEARWLEHFREVLNQPTPPTLFNLGQEPPAPTLGITSDEISGTEVARAIKSLKNNKAPGLDEVCAELLKHGQEVVVESLTHLFNMIWHREDVPADWRRGVIVMLPKKGNLGELAGHHTGVYPWQGILQCTTPAPTSQGG